MRVKNLLFLTEIKEEGNNFCRQAIGDSILKISFNQQSVSETKNRQIESQGINGREQTGKNYPVKNHPAQGAVNGGSIYAPGFGRDGLPGNGAEKGKSLIELQQEAENADVGISQDYMTVMSHTLSEEDYAKAREEGFDFGNMNPEETVTIVDKIKAELVRAGKKIAGYTDDLDLETLTAALGSQVLAEAVAESFRQADLPLTEENLELTKTAWMMAAELQPLEQGGIRYLIDNEMSSEIWNLYVAENSGAAGGGGNVPGFFAEDVQGYYAMSALQPGREGTGLDKAAGEAAGTAEDAVRESHLARQIEGIIAGSGREVNEESRRDAAWLLENGLPLTEENLNRLEELKSLELPVTPERFAKAAADAVAEGKTPVHGLLSGGSENLYEKAARTERYYRSEEAWESCAGDITARRQLEEIRLRMTAEVNVKLLKSGFSIDTAPMERLVEALRQAEAQLAEQYFPGDEKSVEKYRSFRDTDTVLRELPGLPAGVLGTFAEGISTESLESFHREGKALEDTYKKAGESYEALMTEPRRDLGDSIGKAFANVDDILKSLGQAPTEENRRAARILGYNRMEMNLENLEKVKEADRIVQTVVEKLTPAATLKMIRDGVNPLEKSFAELEQYFEELPEDYQTEAVSYSRFLYGLERKHDITPEERESYIGIYRLLRQVEKTDGAAVGALVNAQAELHFGNLLSAVRSGRCKSLDAKVGDEMGAVAERIRKGESISEQIGKAFVRNVEKAMTDVSYSKETETAYDQEQLQQYREAVAAADRECTAMLGRGDIPVGADNLLAAAALLEGNQDLFAEAGAGKRKLSTAARSAGGRDLSAGEERKAEDAKLWELLDDAEEFRREYEDNIAGAQADAEEATFDSTDRSLDVRRMQLVHKQLTVAGALAKKQEFFLPLDIDGKTARVHLMLERGADGAGTVEINVRAGQEEKTRAIFRFEKGTLNGIIKIENKNEVMKTQRIADIFKEEAGESWELGDISVVSTDVRFPEAVGVGMEAGTENAELYRVAKVFLHAYIGEGSAEQEGVSYAN